MGMVACTCTSMLVAGEVYTDLKSAVFSPAVSPRFNKRDCNLKSKFERIRGRYRYPTYTHAVISGFPTCHTYVYT